MHKWIRQEKIPWTRLGNKVSYIHWQLPLPVNYVIGLKEPSIIDSFKERSLVIDKEITESLPNLRPWPSLLSMVGVMIRHNHTIAQGYYSPEVV